MKAGILVLLYLYCSVECRKASVPIDKNANLAFINMEGGGGAPPPTNRPQQPAAPSSPTNIKPSSVTPTSPPVKPIVTVVAPTPAPTPRPAPTPAKPPANPAAKSPATPPATPARPTPVTTPGPGTVKQLVNFYDSQGKASPIRPYSYSQAVKQG